MISPRNMEVELNSTSAFSMCSWNWKDRTANFWTAIFCSKYTQRERERKPVSERGRRKKRRWAVRQRQRTKKEGVPATTFPWQLSKPFFHALKRPSCPMLPRYTNILTTNPSLLVLTGFCCLQSNESPPRSLRTLIQVKERNSSAPYHVFPKETL